MPPVAFREDVAHTLLHLRDAQKMQEFDASTGNTPLRLLRDAPAHVAFITGRWRGERAQRRQRAAIFSQRHCGERASAQFIYD